MKKVFTKKRIWVTVSILTMIALWWILAETAFRRSLAVPAPPEVLRQMWISAGTGALWLNSFNTLWKVFAAFLISLVLGFGAAVAAVKSVRVRYFISPIVTVVRAVPTMGVILILFIIIRRPETAAIVIAVMMVFPMLYEGFYTSIKETDGQLLQMARVHKIPFNRRLTGIYAPHMAPYFFSSAAAGVGMCLKVVIAAEIIGIPAANTIGTAMFNAQQILGQAGLIFMWVLVTVIIGFLLEATIRGIGRACMPWRKK